MTAPLADAGAAGSRSVAASRQHACELLVQILDGSGCAWAWQGPSAAPGRWLTDTGPDDLDVWCDADPLQAERLVTELSTQLPAAVVAYSRDPRRLRHCSLAVETAAGLAVLDLTFADLRVGVVLLLGAADVRIRDATDGPRLAGVAAAADLLIGPLLRGRIPGEARIEEARVCWQEAGASEWAAAGAVWRPQLGPVTDRIVAVLNGATPDPDLAVAARRRLLVATVSPSGLTSAARQWRSVLPAGRSAGPIGLRTRGVVVALVGTDGSGKSTVARDLAGRLHTAGFLTTDAYFGMARGNLPGVALARRILRVPDPAQAQEQAAAEPGGGSDAVAEPGETDPSADRPMMRRVAAWYYAAEYVWRYGRMVAPARWARHVVVCDRYVYDLRDSPWPGSAASRVTEWLVPRPDVLVLPDAPIPVIHARKPERTEAEQARQQEAFRALLAEHPARCSEVIVDTNGTHADAVGRLVRAVVSATHLHRRT